MQSDKTKFWCLFILPITISLNLYMALADASVYASKSNKTRIALFEPTQKGEKLEGNYFTEGSGRNWLGTMFLTMKKGNTPGRTNYVGTFKDFTTGPDTRFYCEGDVSLTIISEGVALKNKKEIVVNWIVKTGEKCPSVGQKYSLTLAEAFPNPDKNGDFFIENTDDWMGGATDNTWETWRVVTQELNCRNTPQGMIKKTYQKGELVIAKNNRDGSALVGSDGKIYPFKGNPWLRTKDDCYVRANSQYIKPTSNPF